MNLEYTLQCSALQLKNKPRTLSRVARVFQKIMKTRYQRIKAELKTISLCNTLNNRMVLVIIVKSEDMWTL